MFRRKTQRPFQESEIPVGSFIKTEKGYFYVQSSNRRYRFTTDRVLQSWSPQRIIECSEDNTAVMKLKIFAKMQFRNGSLLYSQSDGNMYLVSENKLRPITNANWLNYFDRKDAVWVSQEEMNLHDMGAPLS